MGTCDTWFSGIASLALTASKWSRRAIKLFTCSSNRIFSERNWCKHESNDATENRTTKTTVNHFKQLTCYWLNLLSKCWACSIKNCDPCSHCLSRSCSRLWGVLPCAVGWPVPPSIELRDGPCGWLDTLFRAYFKRKKNTIVNVNKWKSFDLTSQKSRQFILNSQNLHWPIVFREKRVQWFVYLSPYSTTYKRCALPSP